MNNYLASQYGLSGPVFGPSQAQGVLRMAKYYTLSECVAELEAENKALRQEIGTIALNLKNVFLRGNLNVEPPVVDIVLGYTRLLKALADSKESESNA